jgi:hypothetical protein
MANQVRNIIIGAAAVWLSAKDSTQAGWGSGPAVPAGTANTTVVPALDAATTDWRSVGFTREGLEISYEPDFGDVEVDQLLDSAKLYKQSMRVTVNTTFAEATLENLLVAWGQQGSSYVASAAAGDVTDYASAINVGDSVIGISSGALGDEPVERALVAVGVGPRTAAGVKRERVYHARRVLSVDSSSQALRRNEATVFPVSFRLLPDPAAVKGAEYGIIRDRNIA